MKKKNHIKVRFSTLLLCCLAILLCTAAYGAHNPDYTLEVGDVLNVGTDPDMDVERIESDYLMVKGGTVNLYPGAYVYGGIYADDGSAVNIYAGELGADYSIMLLSNSSTPAVVTVYGTGFKVDGELLDTSATQFTLDSFGVLTGSYENGAPIHLLFCSFSDVPIHLVNLDVEVEIDIDIDIKPGGNPNNINPRSKGVVPVAILTTDGFNSSSVEPTTVEFAGTKPIRWKICNVDEDDDLDMLFHFDTQELFKNDLNEDSTEATLTGKTKDEVEISGTDTVCIKPQKKKK